MSAISTSSSAGDAARTPERPKRRSFLRLLLRNRLAGLGLVVLAAIVAIAILAPILPLADPNATAPANRLLPPLSEGHLLGTDELGRDLLSRLVWGTRLSLFMGVAATLVAALLGSTIGLVAGYFGGRLDNALMRSIDMLMAFPYILLALAIVAVLGPGLLNALYAVAIVNIPFFARNIRGVTVGLSHKDFVEAARLSGMGHGRILVSEVLPNVMPVIVITMSTTVGWMILETAGLSFLGLGSQPPQADLGSILGEGRKVMLTAPHVTTIAGITIFLLVMSINLVGDGVRDALDPRLSAGALARPAPVTRIARAKNADDAAPPEGSPALAVRRLSTRFEVGERIYRAVNDVSFTIRRGECLGLVGESGSGKSVTALSLLGLVPSPPGVIRAGRVWREGEDVLSLSREKLRALRGGRVSYIFQDPLTTLHPLFTVGDQLVEAIRAHRPASHAEAWTQAVALLDRVRIPAAADRAEALPHELSGGMRQRVAIAMALANEPDLIIADEPTTALDVTVQAQILALLDELRRESGLALLFITHDFGVVSQLCDRVAVMYAGKIVEEGPTQAVLEAPAHPYTRLLIACVPILGSGKRALDAIPGLPPAVDRLPDGCAFAPRCPRATAACKEGEIPPVSVADRRSARCLYAGEVMRAATEGSAA
ncbi:dipeptide/oligopeptide/nickel ABC transporter permease/ATP-binding protein [Salinarimonas ramus]|uniref:Peptide ABC transporter permease n=1 Tax=Salinarimonas ramus TaxID=690164 RepID=A0A917Q4H2_9HYPH|nr:dipeptide/oligopeptide/nickel ABC transporter permease/ATP-binding protein [Salinarimonas ramus]GGK22055.1 peptide ABC transporter permease [Salinarimonas ramus]